MTGMGLDHGGTDGYPTRLNSASNFFKLMRSSHRTTGIAELSYFDRLT